MESVFKEFLERGILKCSLAKTLVCLILKKENSNRVEDVDVRPIPPRFAFWVEWASFVDGVSVCNSGHVGKVEQQGI